MPVIDRTGDIISGLSASTTITDWVGKIHNMPNISSGRTPNAIMPAITINTVFNRDGEYADDEAYSSELRYQVTVFSQGATPNRIASAIDDLMKGLGFTRHNLYPLFDQETKINQTVMLFDDEPIY